MKNREDDFIQPDGATPISRDALKGLKMSSVTNQAELNEVEQANILAATRWADPRRHKDILTDTFVRKLHKKMFEEVWKWAGKYRTTDVNPGIDWRQIPTAVNQLLKNTAAWIEFSSYPWPEIATRFHHKLVLIHPFTNGNGRHARMMTDLLLGHHLQPPCSWGAKTYPGEDVQNATKLRSGYIKALQEADAGRFQPLQHFMFS